MSLRHNRGWLVLGLLLAGDVWALGLGDIRLSSALNEPLRAEIQLLSATPEELSNLKVQLAPAATFERYGVDRPMFLTRLQFTVLEGGQSGTGSVRITSSEPITEPFVTFLVEATWSRGRLLREYTVLLDPPTFAPPPSSQSTQAVTAPSRATPADSGRIERPASAPTAPAQSGAASDTASSGAAAGGEVYVERGDTLWEIAARVRPDNRVDMNQVMLAIYEANPQAFAGNINRLNAGATLRIPRADDIFRINRVDALSEVQRQYSESGLADARTTRPSLTLVPPDADQPGYAGASSGPSAGDAASDATADRIRELEETIADQNSLIEIRDNELAQLRDELARLRDSQAAAADVAPADVAPEPEVAAPSADEAAIDDTDELFAEDEEVAADEEATGERQAEPAPATAVQRTPRPAAQDEPGIVERIVDALTGFWGILGIGLLLVLAILVWLAKRAAGRGDEESTGVWEALDSDDDIDSESRASTERLRALARDDDSSIVVVEQDTDRRKSRKRAATAKATATGTDFQFDDELAAATSVQPTFEDTFSSETAINLDQSDPVAEADFHMAYGLYDQAADLVNGALAVEPERLDLMAKLCEIYFVWGNRDAFIEAATRLHDQLGGETSPDWDKIVIMGQQIAGEHRLFSGKSAAGAASRAVDLSFDADDGAGVLDMDFAGGPDGEVSHVFDLGAEEVASEADSEGLDFLFEEEPEAEPAADTGATITREMPKRTVSDDSTVESPTLESAMSEHTMESPTMESPTVESPTVESPTAERPLEDMEGTSELPSLSRSEDDDEGRWSGDATAEIDLDDLGLDLDALAKAGLDGNFDDQDELAANTDFADLDDTRENRSLQPDRAETGQNTELDIDADFDQDEALSATSEMPALDEETGKNPALFEAEDLGSTDVDVDVDARLLDATGQTQVLGDDFSIDSTGKTRKVSRDETKTTLSPMFDDEAETLLASVDDEGYAATSALSEKDLDVDFDFAKTEALPKDAFGQTASADDETGEMPVGSTDVDLDLDDLTSALRFSEGDTVNQPRDDATVEQRVGRNGEHNFVDFDFGAESLGDDAPTEALSPDELSDDLHDARTMTEVGTKLDLARAYVDMGDPDGARSILEEVLDEGDEGQKQQAQRLMESLPA